ncbi:Hypothetical predicted protein [Mytilus galloprovincialis]|uniref:Uncharacterized protein n=1 Tax=Mytilus galloprovincialis TaxID=29158 RepID=A0A8B6DUL3_MYTGA|nr:Hypothetical predicted protein [Mytilus galloprovincialis]
MESKQNKTSDGSQPASPMQSSVTEVVEELVVVVTEEELRQLDPEVQGSPGASVETTSPQRVQGMAQGQEVCRDQSGSQAHSEVATSHYRGQGGSVGTGMSCPVSGYEARGPGLEGHILAVHVAEVFQDLVVSDQGLARVRLTSMSTLQGPKECCYGEPHPLGNKPTGDWGADSRGPER